MCSTISGSQQSPPPAVPTPVPTPTRHVVVDGFDVGHVPAPGALARALRQYDITPQLLCGPDKQLLRQPRIDAVGNMVAPNAPNASDLPNHTMAEAVDAYLDPDAHGPFFDITCAITQAPFVRPMSAGDGHTYERAEITAHMARIGTGIHRSNRVITSPRTNAPIPPGALVMNRQVQRLMLYHHMVYGTLPAQPAAIGRSWFWPACLGASEVDSADVSERRLVAEALRADLQSLQAAQARNAAPAAVAAARQAPSALSAPTADVRARGGLFASKQTVKHLQRELRTILREAEAYKAAGVEVVLPNENSIMVWHAHLYPTPPATPESHAPLHNSMQQLGAEHVLLRLTFPRDYPREPPEVLIVSPRIDHQYVFSGALCADLLTRQHWKPTYRVGEVLIQLLAFLQEDRFRATAVSNQRYNLSDASRFFRVSIERADVWSWNG